MIRVIVFHTNNSLPENLHDDEHRQRHFSNILTIFPDRSVACFYGSGPHIIKIVHRPDRLES